MEWVKEQYKDTFLFFAIGSCLLAAFAPWLSAIPFWLGAITGFLGAYFSLTLLVIARVLLAAAFKKKNQNSG